MIFLVDQNLSVSFSSRLCELGHISHHTSELQLEKAPDADLFEWCRTNTAILVTADKKLTKYLADQQCTTPSVIIFRGYALNILDQTADLEFHLASIENVVTSLGPAVFSLSRGLPTRYQLLPIRSEI